MEVALVNDVVAVGAVEALDVEPEEGDVVPVEDLDGVDFFPEEDDGFAEGKRVVFQDLPSVVGREVTTKRGGRGEDGADDLMDASRGVKSGVRCFI